MLKIKINPRKNSLIEAYNSYHPFCSKLSTSNGFILSNGEYIPGDGKVHEELAFELVQKYPNLMQIMLNMTQKSLASELVRKGGLVKVSNAFGYEINKKLITPEQAKKICELVMSCDNSSKNLLNVYDVESQKTHILMVAAFVEPKHIIRGNIQTDLYESITKKYLKEAHHPSFCSESGISNLISAEGLVSFCDPRQTSFGFIYPNGDWDNAYEGNDIHSDIAARIISNDMVKYSNVIKMLGFERLEQRQLREKLKQTNQLYFLLVLEEGFVKVSNAFSYMINPDKISVQQRNKIVELVLSCRNASENRLRIYDVRTNSIYVDIKASEITDKIVARGSISRDFYESINKKFKKFVEYE